MIPASYVADGELRIEINSVGSQGEAILSGFAVYDVITAQSSGHGGGQSAQSKAIPSKVGYYLRPVGLNPGRGLMTVEYGIPTAARVSVRVYDRTGRVIRQLLQGYLQAGIHRSVWDGNDDQGGMLPAGVYFCRVEWQGKTLTEKLVRLK